jgi:hypothetical protein
VTSRELFFPHDTSDFLGLSDLPPFRLWVEERQSA